MKEKLESENVACQSQHSLIGFSNPKRTTASSGIVQTSPFKTLFCTKIQQPNIPVKNSFRHKIQQPNIPVKNSFRHKILATKQPFRDHFLHRVINFFKDSKISINLRRDPTKKRVHIPDDLHGVKDNEEDEAWIEWGQKKRMTIEEFDPPPENFSDLNFTQMQEEVTK
ncbi:hypothetical protein CTI12_AA176540 [Artemisia annua]|uniref:Uncharacterized protein n=1 Tax=Artemisia annua TaxID=35608 RepID=A0A2U1PA47_ARTAN|nr:hypothetical protein CTI12_AA176540 [Artemisia annua]